MDVDTLAELIASLGFPIAVTTYLLVRYDRLMRELTESIRELTKVMRNRD